MGVRVLPGGDAFLLLTRKLGRPAHVPSAVNVYIGEETPDEELLPMIRVAQSGELPGIPADCPAIGRNALTEKIQKSRTSLTKAALDVISKLRTQCAGHGIILPLCVVRGMMDYAEAAQNLVEGGISAALDSAVLIYAAPFMKEKVKDFRFLNDLTKAMPLTRAALKLK